LDDNRDSKAPSKERYCHGDGLQPQALAQADKVCG
jgi:hypothetical protein